MRKRNDWMKILKLSPYYNPEQISSSHLTNDLEEAKPARER